jgi:hypothetical protein
VKLGFAAMVDPTETAMVLVSSVTVEGPLGGAIRVDNQLGMPRLRVTGTLGASYRIEYAPVMPPANWIVLSNVSLSSSPFLIIDNIPIPAGSHRFYRATLAQ